MPVPDVRRGLAVPATQLRLAAPLGSRPSLTICATRSRCVDSRPGTDAVTSRLIGEDGRLKGVQTRDRVPSIVGDHAARRERMLRRAVATVVASSARSQRRLLGLASSAWPPSPPHDDVSLWATCSWATASSARAAARTRSPTRPGRRAPRAPGRPRGPRWRLGALRQVDRGGRPDLVQPGIEQRRADGRHRHPEHTPDGTRDLGPDEHRREDQDGVEPDRRPQHPGRDDVLDDEQAHDEHDGHGHDGVGREHERGREQRQPGHQLAEVGDRLERRREHGDEGHERHPEHERDDAHDDAVERRDAELAPDEAAEGLVTWRP